MANRCVIFNTDNAALVDIINHHTSKHKLVMILVRDLVLTSLRHNIMFRARPYSRCSQYSRRLHFPVSGRQVQGTVSGS